MPRLASLLAASLLAHGSSAAYTLVRDYAPQHFFNNFGFYDGDDPTHGTVAYQSRQDAASKGLISTTDSTVRIGVDSTNKVDDVRPSVRIFSNDTYNHGILLVDVMHMPAGCGTWPALWMLGDGDWPANGEIDILEGANDQAGNYMTLHTSSVEANACSIDAVPASGDDGSGALGYSKTDYTGTVFSSNCAYDADTGDNTGCQIQAPTGTSAVYAGSGKTTNADVPTFGQSLNSAAGGTVAMQWTDDGIKVWFFGRTQAKPADVAAAINLGADPPTLAPSNDAWGKPLAHFSGPDCDWAKRFNDMRIVVNIDLCGDWGAATWPSGSCPTTTGYDSCENYVKENPQAFTEAYWEFGAFRWFEWRDPAPPATTTTAATSSSSSSSGAVVTIKTTKTETFISSSSSTSSVAKSSTSSAPPAAPTVIYSTISAPSTTSRPFTYAPTTEAAPTVAATASTTSSNAAASTSSSGSWPANESAKGDAQYMVNGKLPLGGAETVTVSWSIMTGGAVILAAILL
ncbi:glycoside hydrolase family 16 protein [Diplodia corticola]|uniref:Glycoside hydrolase family 16 protein n=1 Tax=Diplodia corticola TaxID=236234 RepID=A0A1J9RDC8_9PEZI|nr:glycoside hydrolase family 16 protein [Diplodia corticola]OJD38098.1 glycoside hydrolase family 16 protein [Diplodia corticola]